MSYLVDLIYAMSTEQRILTACMIITLVCALGLLRSRSYTPPPPALLLPPPRKSRGGFVAPTRPVGAPPAVRRSGQTLVEYVLILSLVAGFAFVVLVIYGQSLSNLFSRIIPF